MRKPPQLWGPNMRSKYEKTVLIMTNALKIPIKNRTKPACYEKKPLQIPEDPYVRIVY